MFDYLRIVSAVPDLKVGDTEFNANEICRHLAMSDGDVTVFPELSITGYTCGDLFFQSQLLESAKKALLKILKVKTESATAVGMPIVIDGQMYNCAVFIYGGNILGIVPKTFLPNYNEYYERRWFSSSEDLCIREISSTELGINEIYSIPVGKDLLFRIGGVKVAVEICEDLWTPLPPSTFAAIEGAEVILNLSASNETISKRAYRKELVRQQSARLMCTYVYCSAGSCESTTDLIFSGHSVIAENGVILKENEDEIDSGYTISTDTDIEKLRHDRKKNKSFKDARMVYGYEDYLTVNTGKKKLSSDGSLYNVQKLPFVPSAKADRLERCMSIFKMQAAGLKKRIEVTGSKAVVGVSGGLDSTLALLVAVEAMRLLGRKPSDVIGITMPCFGTTDRTYKNAVKLIKDLGVRFEEIDIKNAVSTHFEDIGQNADNHDLTYENSQARERTQVLMDYAGKCGGFVVGTGDLSELALGWCTYNADHMSMYGVNASIPKTLVRWMIESLAEYEVFSGVRDILLDVMDTPISPELLPPDENGKIAQVTEDIVGPYALHDFYLYYFLRYGFSPKKIYFLAQKAFKDDFDNEAILKWLKNFYRRFFSQQFKRSCLPDGVKVGSICLSPRGDWRMPSDATASIWLKEIENM